jgi:hypothetical protein
MTDRLRATLHLRVSTTRQTQFESAGRVGYDCASSPNMPSQSLRRCTMIAERRRMIDRACDADHPNVARSFLAPPRRLLAQARDAALRRVRRRRR